MVAARIIVWRHGRTEWNATGRFQGQSDIELDELGRAQAAAAAPVLAAMGPVRLVSSDLKRAYATAGALAAVSGLTIETDPRLREIHVGTWAGLTAAEVAVLDPERAAKYEHGVDVRRSATGETVAEVGERVATALAEIGDAAPDGSTVVVAMHGLAARVGVCRLVGFPPETWYLLSGLHNCGWITVERHRAGYWRIRDYNVTAGAPVPALDPVSTVLDAFAAGDHETLRLALHPYLHWTESGTTTRGRTKVLALLAGRTALARPTSYELRDGQIYRWHAPD